MKCPICEVERYLGRKRRRRCDHPPPPKPAKRPDVVPTPSEGAWDDYYSRKPEPAGRD